MPIPVVVPGVTNKAYVDESNGVTVDADFVVEGDSETLIETDAATDAVTIEGSALILANLPTADPEVVGQLWSNSGVLTVSAGA